MLVTVFLQCAMAVSLAIASDPWGENLNPKLKVNYLSQKSGKTDSCNLNRH